jgi:hypothetical protein
VEVIRSSKTSVYIQTTRRYIPEDGDIQSKRITVRRCNTIVLDLQANAFRLTAQAGVQSKNLLPNALQITLPNLHQMLVVMGMFKLKTKISIIERRKKLEYSLKIK